MLDMERPDPLVSRAVDLQCVLDNKFESNARQ